MKIMKYFIAAAAIITSLTACNSDLDKTTFDPSKLASGELQASESVIELNAANTKEDVLTLAWGASDFGIPVAVTYTIEMDARGGDFSKPYELAAIKAGNSKTFTGKDLNKAILAWQAANGMEESYEPQELDFRVRSSFSEDAEEIITNIVSVTITPYAGKVEYAKLSVPGSHQGWDPLNYNQALYATDKDHPDIYTGYVYMDAGTEFKIADGQKGQDEQEDKWAINWGSSDGYNLEPGGSNIYMSESGCYYITVDLANLTIMWEKRDWSVVGDAVGGWDNDVDLVYDKDNNFFRATINFVEGNFKFRANHNWDINLGKDPTGDDYDLAQNGDNISALPGEYTVTLSFVDGYPTYALYAGSEVSTLKYVSMPGSMNGWAADTKDNILLLAGGVYSGWLYCDGSTMFKITLGSWADDDTFGWNAEKSALTHPGDNIQPEEAGMYFITADLEGMSIQLDKHNWSIVGSALTGDDDGWNQDLDLTWNPELKVLEGTFNLIAGEFKFRADHAWGLNYGGADGKLQRDGSNIDIYESGQYHITLDLQTTFLHQEPTYTISK